MKKHSKKIVIMCLIAVLFVALPKEVAATTLQDYIDKVNKYEKEVKDANDKIHKTDEEIATLNREINQIKADMKQASADIDRMNDEINKYNIEIKEKSKQTKQLFQYLQMSNSGNIYLEYLFGADSVTDLVYRMSIVEQLTDYNNKAIANLEKMIEENKQREKELKKKKEELDKKQVTLNLKISELEGEKVAFQEGALSSNEQLKAYQDIVDMYRDKGCKANDVIGVDCARESGVAGWYRPTDRGYITGEMGYRDISIGGDNFHYGIDMSSPNRTQEAIHPVASGTVASIRRDSYGANIVIIYHYDPTTGKYYSSFYCHLSRYASGLYVGQKVTPESIIGYMGDTGFAYGVHLHLEIVDCKLYDPTDPNCYNWSSYTRYVKKRYNEGFKGARSLIYFPSNWYSRY